MLVWAAAFLVAAQTPPADPYWTLIPPRPELSKLPRGAAISFPKELAVWLGSDSPSASYTSQVALIPTAQRVVAFYQVFEPKPPRRRVVVRSLASFGSHPMRALWADSRTCPGLIDRLKTLDDFHVEVSAPYGLSRRQARVGNTDGVGVELRTKAVGDQGNGYDVAIEGNGETLVDWAQATNAFLESCLSTRYPPDLPVASTAEVRYRRYSSPSPAAAPPPPGGPPSGAGPAPRL